MEVSFTYTTSGQLKTLPIVNGQIIALLDQDAYYYDLKDKRHQVIGLEFMAEPPQGTIGSTNKLYIVVGNPSSIYVWDTTTQNYVKIAGTLEIEVVGTGNGVADISVNAMKMTITRAAFADESAFRQHLNNNANPHKVTKDQVGLGKVENESNDERTVGAAKKLAEERNVSLTGDVTAKTTFDGSADLQLKTTLVDTPVAPGSYGQPTNVDGSGNQANQFVIPYITFDSKGRATAASQSTVTINPQTDISGKAGSADKLTEKRNVEGVMFDGSEAVTHYGYCITEGSSAAKTVDVSNFALMAGARVIVTFQNACIASNMTLDVNSTGPKSVKYLGAPIPANTIKGNSTYEFVYDGLAYILIGEMSSDMYTYMASGGTSDGPNLSSMITSSLDGVGGANITIIGSLGGGNIGENVTIPAGKQITLDFSNAIVTNNTRIKFSGVAGTLIIKGLKGNLVAMNQILVNLSGGYFELVESTVILNTGGSSGITVEGTGTILIHQNSIKSSGTAGILTVDASGIYGKVTQNNLESFILAVNKSRVLFDSNIVGGSFRTEPQLELKYNNIIRV